MMTRLALLIDRIVIIALALTVSAACAGARTPDDLSHAAAYQPVPSPTRIDASVSIEAVHDVTPELRAFWRKHRYGDPAMELYRQAFVAAVTADLADSGLFSRIVSPDANPRPDYVVKLHTEVSKPSDVRLRMKLEVFDGATLAEVSAHTRDVTLGDGVYLSRVLPLVLPPLMAGLKRELATDLLKSNPEQPQSVSKRAGAFENASLSDLLVAADRSVSLARERNHAIIAAKNRQLPSILRDSKTAELTALLVKIEQTVLDLNHESEVAKDRAEQAVANPETIRQGRGGSANPGLLGDEMRDLSISYRERIELLNPIAAAVKDEIANRNR